MLKQGYKSKAWNSPQKWKVPVLALLGISLFLILVVFFLLKSHNDGQQSSLAHEVFKQRWNIFESSVQLHPTREFRNGTDLIWQIPKSPKAVLFLAHGCNGRAVNFWDQSPDCPSCIGLPEERLLVLHGLARGFAIITISSLGRCWTFGEEVLIGNDIIKWWTNNKKLEKLPLVALGASSGGYFVSVLATNVRFSRIVLMIAEGMFQQMDIEQNYPPTLFVHMPKDLFRQQKIDENMEMLRNKGINVSVIECKEFPLSSNVLADRIPGLDQTISAKLFKLFQMKGFIDQNGYMRKDGRTTQWKKALKESKNFLLDKRLVPHIQEELNLAFAYHEMTSLHSDQIFKWFESHMN
ncbi:Secretion-regulating guanine nucleotide exchange factor [Quillaja saponaria]|uniref:Secretion-regulating guanine nucleotide exchange factor n=1 Tax=Quillaja saponaria TaxID=32244 RepID=A0AAD7LT93_QUISA|nr:Secretion-regulating guanine nucleotide exchange factor [Quillaja saponaria]